MSFHAKQNVFTGSQHAARRKCKPKPIATPIQQNPTHFITVGVGQAIRLPNRKQSNHHRKIQTKANFHPIQQNSSHFITFHHYRPKSAPQGQNSKPNPISTRSGKIHTEHGPKP